MLQILALIEWTGGGRSIRRVPIATSCTETTTLLLISSYVPQNVNKQGEFIVQLLAKVAWNWNAI
jgi:hypothetical protein